MIAIMLLMPAMMYANPPKASMPNIDLGIKLGANFDKLAGSTWESGYKTGFLGGAFAGLRASKFGVQIEGFFSQTKYVTSVYKIAPSLVSNAADSARKGNFRAGYFNIPVLAQVKLLPMLWLQAGPQYSGLISVKDVDGFVKDAKGLFKGGTVSGVLGLELKTPVHLNVGARYILGFSDMNNTAAVSGAWQNRTIQLHVGYSFL